MIIVIIITRSIVIIINSINKDNIIIIIIISSSSSSSRSSSSSSSSSMIIITGLGARGRDRRALRRGGAVRAPEPDAPRRDLAESRGPDAGVPPPRRRRRCGAGRGPVTRALSRAIWRRRSQSDPENLEQLALH